MRDPERIGPMIELLDRAWRAAPDMRLAQLITAAINPSQPVPGVFYAEDDKVRQGLESLLGRLEEQRNQG